MLQNFNMSQTERVLIIKNWQGWQGLELLEILAQTEQETYNNEEDLLKILNKKFKLQYNETSKSLQFHNLIRQHNKSAEEWMGRLTTAAMESTYKEEERQ